MLQNQRVLITGATLGIGLEFARLLYKEGYNLILVSRTRPKLEDVKKKLETGKNSITIFQADLSQPNAARDIYEQCRTLNMPVDILINNAGSALFGEHTELSPEEIAKMLTLNTTAVTELCHLFGSRMKARGSGYILNIASTAAYQPVPMMAAYAASKSYVLHFSEALAKEMEDHGVSVTCLSPGHTKTNFFSSAGIESDTANGFFSERTQMRADDVAQFGLDALFAKRLSLIPGVRNNILAIANRFVPRWVVASISKGFTQNP